MANNEKILYVLTDLGYGRTKDIFEKYGPCKITKEGAFYVVTYDDWRDCRDAFVQIAVTSDVHCGYTKEKAQGVGELTLEEDTISEDES